MIKKSALVALCILNLLVLSKSVHAETWRQAKTQNFIVYSNESDQRTKVLTKALEDYHYVLSTVFSLTEDSDTAPSPFEVVLVKNRNDFRVVYPNFKDDIAGFYSNCTDGAIAFSATDTRNVIYKYTSLTRGLNENDMIVLFHEYAHRFMKKNFAIKYPAWVVEGFAEYYSTMTIKGPRVILGYIDTARYTTLAESTWLPYRDIIGSDTPYTKTEDKLKFYAQSWLLVHYITSDPKRTAAFNRFITRRNLGEDPIKSFEDELKFSVDDLGKILKAYLKKGIPATSVEFLSMPMNPLQIDILPPEADKLLLPKMALKLCSDTMTTQTLQKIDSKNLVTPFGRLVMARALIRENKPEMALIEINALPDNDKNLHEAQFLMGIAKLSIATNKTTEPDVRKKNLFEARAALLKAYSSNPSDAPTLYYLAKSYEGTPQSLSDNAINAAIQATALSPNIAQYAFFAAYKLIQKNRFEDAITVLEPIANNPHISKSTQRARDIIADIKAKQPLESLMKHFTSTTAT